MREGSYYEASAGPVAPRAALQGPLETAVCIVGAGFAGLATALGLVERGVRDIVVLEAGTVGQGASGRNGGFVFGGYSLDCERLLAQQGPQRARALYELTRRAVATIRRRIQAHAIDCDVVDAGVLLADWFDDDAPLRARQALMARAFDTHWRLLPPDEMQAYTRSPRYHGGLLEPDAFHFHPLKYARGLARVLEAAGVRLFEHTPARALARAGGEARVRTDAGEVRARELVMCGGGYLRGVCAPLERATLPIATYVMATEPLGAALAASIPGRAAIYDTRFAFDYYRPLPDTRLLWGGRISILERDARSIARLLRADLARVYPALRDAKIEHAWGGLMSYARHEMPQIGRLPDGTWHALGFGGHGVGPTTAAGELIAAAIAHREPIPEAFTDYGLPPVWGHAGRLAAQARYQWAEFKDWLRS